MSNLSFMLQGEANIIESFQEAIALKIINLECCDKALPVTDGLVPEINRRLVIIDLFRTTHQLRHTSLVESDRQEAVLQAIVCEDVCERRRDDRAKTIIGERPGRVFT